MPRSPENRGTCAYCGEVTTKRGVIKHLEKCSKRIEALQSTEASSRPTETLWHLQIQDAYLKDFWLTLECCGHLSEFTIGGWRGVTVAKARKADSIFESGLVLRHLYDFGTTSETDIKVIGYRIGKATSKHPIALLARNQMPPAFCQECGQEAKWLCNECLYDENKTGFLCDEHVKEHPHENYGEPLPLYNSPRTGMCGYEGPALPPY
jgi:hypothetical protein